MGLISCKKKKNEEEQNLSLYDSTPYNLNFGNLPPPTIPTDNPLTNTGVALGRNLFYEKMLSKDLSMSCASCHAQENSFSDTNRFSIGVNGLPGKRQAMAVVNMLWNSNDFFWDGRANLLRHQSVMPIQDALEMDETIPNVISKLEANPAYKVLFEKAFGDDKITEERIALALEQFMNSLVSYNSKYDKNLRGEMPLTVSEQRGRDLFFLEYNPFFPSNSGADCAHCHSGPNFENDQYMNNGLDGDGMMSDSGRMKVTNNLNDKAKFKVPTLRNIELTPPYMHDGRFQTLEEVVDHYNSGIDSSSTLDPALDATRATGLMLSVQDKQDLVAFLKTLTDYDFITNSKYSDPNQ